MKKIMMGFLVILSLILGGCSGSEAIKKTWQVEDASQNTYTMEINDNEIILTGSAGDEKKAYSQNAVGTSSANKYYGLLIDRKQYSIVFPEKGNDDVALFLKMTIDDGDYSSGDLVYAMHAKDTPSYIEYVEKYLK